MHKFLSLLLFAGLLATQLKIDAAAIEQRELFRTENWKTSSPDIVCRTGEAGIRIQWNGNPRKDGVLRFIPREPVTPGSLLRARVQWKKLSHRTGSAGVFYLRFADASGRTVAQYPLDHSNIRGYRPMELWEFNTPIALQEKLDYFSFWKVPQNSVSVEFFISFRGNAQSLELQSVEYSTADESARPWEKTPPQPAPMQHPSPGCSNDMIGKLLKARTAARPELKKEGDRIELYVDGQRIVPAILHNNTGLGSVDRDSSFRKAGYRVFTVPVLIGRAASRSKHAQVWRDDGTFDIQVMEQAVYSVLREAPDALIILSVSVSPNLKWQKENPAELMKNEAGEFAVLEGYKLRGKFSGNIPEERGKSAYPSHHSRKFRADISAVLEEIFRRFEKTDAAKAVIGAYVVGGCDGQYRAPRTPERTPLATRMFQDYLRKKYGSEKELNRIWQTQDIRFDSIQIPTMDELSPDRLFLANAGHATRESDYKLFVADELYQYKTAMRQGIKQGSGGRLLVGGYDVANSLIYGTHLVDLTEYQEQMLRDKVTDFMIWLPTYHRNRDDCDMPLGLQSYNGSMVLNRKLAIAEMDIRNPELPPLVYPGVKAANWQAVHNHETFRNFIRLYTGYAMAWGGSFHTYLLASGWYDSPKAVSAWADAVRIADAAHGRPLSADRIACIADDRAHCFFTNKISPYFDWTRNFRYNPVQSLWRSGIRFDLYLPQDLSHPEFQPPKILLILGGETFSRQRITEIRDKFGKDGRIIVWAGIPGFLSAPESALQIGDVRFRKTADRIPAIAAAENTDPLLNGVGPLFSLPPYAASWEILGNGGKKLAFYSGNGKCAAMVLRHDGFTELILGQPGMLTPELLRNIASEAGIKPFLATNDLCIAGANLLVIGAAAGSGTRSIQLPPGVSATALTGQKITQNQDGTFSCFLKHRECAVLQLSGQEGEKRK